jgi:iron(III) transport system permease protein
VDCAAPPSAARFGDRHRPDQPLEYQGNKLDLRKLLGYLAQYAILPMRVVAASLHAVPHALEQPAWLSGAGWIATLRWIVAPLACRGLLAAWLISFVFALRDVAISIVVYPPGADTLPVRILTLMANGAPSLIAALCIILIAVTLLPLAVAGLWLKFGAARP